MSTKLAVERACQQAGCQADLARKLGVTPPMVQQWRSGTRPVPVRFCAAIESLTSGAVTRQDLRPNDWHLIWPDLVGTDGAPEDIPLNKEEA